MLVRLLGAVEICARDRVFPVGPAQRCAVFAALAVDAGRLVLVDTLMDRVWGHEPPSGARRTLHSHLTRIRRLLEQADASVRLTYRSGGYLLELDPDRVDLHQFISLMGQAGDPRRPDTERATLLHEALGLWRGEPLAGVRGPWADQVRRAWHHHHLDTVLTWARAELRLGAPAAVIGRLIELTARHPLDEKVVATLMRALAAAGRTADAMACYRHGRQRLADELGVDPGPELRNLHQSLLRGAVSTLPGGVRV